MNMIILVVKQCWILHKNLYCMMMSVYAILIGNVYNDLLWSMVTDELNCKVDWWLGRGFFFIRFSYKLHADFQTLLLFIRIVFKTKNASFSVYRTKTWLNRGLISDGSDLFLIRTSPRTKSPAESELSYMRFNFLEKSWRQSEAVKSL